MKKLLIVCLFTLVLGIMSSPAFSQQDSDGDGVPSQFYPFYDNCPTTPNGPNLGTCYSWSGIEAGTTCMSDVDCGGSPGSCDMNQNDTYPPGRNYCGDACECEGDFDGDGDQDDTDETVFTSNQGRTDCTNEIPCNGDFDCDGDVDDDDDEKFYEDFGRDQLHNPCPNCVTTPWCVYAGKYTIDFLEPGNPGGWNASLKTFEDAWTLYQGQTINMDIWLNDVPESLLTGGFWISFDSSLVSIVDVQVYDGDLDGSKGSPTPCCAGLAGPWDPNITMQMQDPAGPGTYMVSCMNFACVAPDEDGDIIQAKVTFECQEPGDVEITISTIPGFDTVFGCGGTTPYDSQIFSKTIIIHQQVCTLHEDCNDGVYCNGAETCESGVCVSQPIPDGTGCDDGLYCTLTDECQGGLCVGSGATCPDDANDCTDDCDEESNQCVHSNNTASCQDGIYCNGIDTCSEGSCSEHSGDPCWWWGLCTTCDEDTDSCGMPPVNILSISPLSASTSTTENVLFTVQGSEQCFPPCYSWAISVQGSTGSTIINNGEYGEYKPGSSPGTDTLVVMDVCNYTIEAATATVSVLDFPDHDGDGVHDIEDNCPEDYNPDQLDSDTESGGDVCDVCPDDATNTCDQDRSAGDSIGTNGGTISTPDDSVSIGIPGGALNDDTSLSITEIGTSYPLTTNLGNGIAVFGVSIQPEGLVFNTPVPIVFTWLDVDDDGKVDSTSIKEDKLIISKDNVAITDRCGQDSGCYATGNTFTFVVSSLSEFALVFIDDEGPIASNILTNPYPAPVDTEIIIAANVDDSQTGDSIVGSAECNIDGGEHIQMDAQDGIFDDVIEDVVGTIPAFTEPGVYNICVRGWDIFENIEGNEECIFLPVYDPMGGFVTGGGWIDSPEGAYPDDTTLTGKANFGFVSKYKKGATVPIGETEFQFKVADLNFHSDAYQWLVIAGARAMYKGTGTINGEGNYGFMLTAIDEKLTPSTDVDMFRIKIWDKDDGDVIVYDNQMDAEDDADPTTEIGGGSIVIHKSK